MIDKIEQIFSLQLQSTGKRRYEDEKIVISGIPEDFKVTLKLNQKSELVCECVFDVFYTYKSGKWEQYLEDIVIQNLTEAVEDQQKTAQVDEVFVVGVDTSIDDSALFTDVL